MAIPTGYNHLSSSPSSLNFFPLPLLPPMSTMGIDVSHSANSSSLLLKRTPAISDFLLSSLGPHHQTHPAVPYKLLRDAWLSSPPASRPSFRHLLSGSSILLVSPKPREKSAELKARLVDLQEKADAKAYRELVKDVAWDQREEHEYFSSYREQLGFGLHVIVVMFTGYLVGYAFFRSQIGGSTVLHAAGGILGMVVGMLVETLLFIIRTSNSDSKKVKPKKIKHPYGSKRD